MSRERFYRIMQCMRLPKPTAEDTNMYESPFGPIKPFLNACLRAWQSAWMPGEIIVVDETMCKWYGMSQAHVTYLARKPTDTGYMAKTLVCA